jgi:hypothetical protein
MTTIGMSVADTTNLAVDTPAEVSSLGVVAALLANPRPDLDGLRVKTPGQPEIYLMDEGYRRWIPNPTTYNNLFRDWNGIQEDVAVGEIPLGTPLADGSVLAMGSGNGAVYLAEAGVKRWITSPAAMDKYYFNWNRIYVIPSILIRNNPDGRPIS